MVAIVRNFESHQKCFKKSALEKNFSSDWVIVGNNPINGLDPLGLLSETKWHNEKFGCNYELEQEILYIPHIVVVKKFSAQNTSTGKWYKCRRAGHRIAASRAHEEEHINNIITELNRLEQNYFSGKRVFDNLSQCNKSKNAAINLIADKMDGWNDSEYWHINPESPLPTSLDFNTNELEGAMTGVNGGCCDEM